MIVKILVKTMFADKNFSDDIKMSGVNSINWARIIAQSVYYFYSYFLIEDDNHPVNFFRTNRKFW